MSSGTITIATLARHLGLGAATVSYALNGRGPEMKISESTVERIRAAADELGYQPNFFASTLRRQRTDSIGVVFADLSDNWADRVLKGMLRVLDGHGYMPLISVHLWDKAREEREVQSLLKRKVDALICLPLPESRAFYKKLMAQKQKLLLLSDTLPDLPEASYVAWDSGKAAREVMEHLLASGRRRIAFVGPTHPTIMTLARYQAYCDCLREARLPLREDWIIWEKSGVVPTEAVRRLLDDTTARKNRPDALFVLNDALALRLLENIREMGVRIPEDVALASMGDFLTSSHRSISLTSIPEPCEEMGEEIARAALKMIRSKRSQRIQQLISGLPLVPRNTAP
ncbi:MAG: LacI family transcriptional regulator [Opitutaceae bacterium]|jgi:LacI family transcriptional regulator|nr:LacI family transcriptional regulator [Opitutaceae bacterium]